MFINESRTYFINSNVQLDIDDTRCIIGLFRKDTPMLELSKEDLKSLKEILNEVNV